MAAQEEMVLLGRGTTFMELSTTALENMGIVLPLLSEQKAIAGFLDEKCKEVDALIGEIGEEIETLEQYKRSVITEAVTKGLDPSAPMKESGIDWLDEIPMLWETKRIAAFYQLRNEKVSDNFPNPHIFGTRSIGPAEGFGRPHRCHRFRCQLSAYIGKQEFHSG